MRRLNTCAARWALLGMVALLGCGLAGLLSQALASPVPLATAKGRWVEGAIAHYRLILEAGNSCRLDVEVRDEAVVRVLHEDSCSYPARTVTGLFSLVEHAVSPLYTCAPPGCACRHIVTIYALYDDQLGYPQKVAVWVERKSNWRERTFWRYVWSARRLPDCVWTSQADIVNVLSVTPLQ